jgi:tetrahydromethanopterin S-methyltransferase subunit E
MTDDQAWHRPKPEQVARPTYCPVTMAVAIVLMVWAPLASWILLAAGAGIFALAATCWINELRNEHRAS